MKKLLLVALSLLGLTCLVSSAMAQSPTAPPGIQEISLETAKAKIRAKETFYLFVGRPDNLDSQQALPQLEAVQDSSPQPIYFLNTKGINSRAYKAFAKKYQIKSPAYLAKFSNRQQVAVYANDWTQGIEDLTAFIQSP